MMLILIFVYVHSVEGILLGFLLTHSVDTCNYLFINLQCYTSILIGRKVLSIAGLTLWHFVTSPCFTNDVCCLLWYLQFDYIVTILSVLEESLDGHFDYCFHLSYGY